MSSSRILLTVLCAAVLAAGLGLAGGLSAEDETVAPPERVRHALVQKKVGFYSVFLPPEVANGSTDGAEFPICVLLPDTGGDDEALANLLGRRGVIYVAPPAAHRVVTSGRRGGPGRPAFAVWPTFPREWGGWGSERFPASEIEALGVERLATDWIADCVLDVRRRYPTKKGRVVVVGHGSGAWLAHLFAVHRPELVETYFAYAGSYRRGMDDDIAALTLKKHRVRPVLVHHEGDPRAEARETRALSTYLAERDVEHELLILPGSSHEFSSRVARRAQEYVAKNCRGEELPPLAGELVVVAVPPDSPAAAAGLRAGDVLLTYNGKELHDRDDFAGARSTLVWGQEEVVITWRREGEEREATVGTGRLGLALEDR